MSKILVVEDDEKLNKIICTFLFKNNYEVVGCRNPIEAYNLIFEDDFDLIISDIMMPKVDGFSFVKEVRLNNPNIPILMMTALDDLSSKTKSFNAGIDDYMVKPVDMDEMILRVNALLRRANLSNDNKLIIGDTTLVKDEKSAYINDIEVNISPREFNVLYKLLSSPKKIFTRSELLDEFWGMSNDNGLRTVDVYITKLRKEFQNSNSFEIITVHGFGYKAILK